MRAPGPQIEHFEPSRFSHRALSEKTDRSHFDPLAGQRHDGWRRSLVPAAWASLGSFVIYPAQAASLALDQIHYHVG